MKTLNQYIQEKLIVNKNYNPYTYAPKSFDELRKIIEDRYDEFGSGTKLNPIDFNDIDVSNLDSFYNNYKGIFEETKFKYIDISEWDVSNIYSMRSMFDECKELESVGDLSKWDVSKVTDMSCMFYNCKSFNQDISGWNVSNVTDMGYMFQFCEKFNQDLSGWNVTKVMYRIGVFSDCPIKNEYMPRFI